ncbi:uracil-DNA glycosylase family protein [Marinivivus vitaminiproducens]|uniref:uracil-DNA glycosylase family protein n=1 Tax=Marinivivus vitaminiproducens TaxID=3035935 RepID=UPI0027AA0D9E|nr:uracil-DNA glycosylase family protein [Geminicoccaceae bacterium SCSIO 64248]
MSTTSEAAAPADAARACRLCADRLPHAPRPILRVDPRARILIASQAPGRAAHLAGIPWADRAGALFRGWLGVDRATFDDPAAFAIVPVSLCYPGRGRSGDLPPLAPCAPRWHPVLLPLLTELRLTLVIGAHAHRRHLGAARRASLTETVRAYRAYLPDRFPLPHPSPRNTPWLRRHPWFEADVLPALRREVARALEAPPAASP